MKKLTLNKINFAGATELTREQLKKVMGGGLPFTTIGPGDPFTATTTGEGGDCEPGSHPCHCTALDGSSWYYGCTITEAHCGSVCGN